MFIVFSEYIEITQADRAEAIRTAALNAAGETSRHIEPHRAAHGQTHGNPHKC